MTTAGSTVSTSVVFDAADAAAAAAFWAELTGGAVAEGASAGYASVERPGAAGMAFNQVPEAKTVKNRVHLDLTVPDAQGAEERAVSLGAAVVARHDGWTAMQDPEGNEFCIMTG